MFVINILLYIAHTFFSDSSLPIELSLFFLYELLAISVSPTL